MSLSTLDIEQAIAVALFSGDKRALSIPGIEEKQIIGITKGYILTTQQYADNIFACICTLSLCFFCYFIILSLFNNISMIAMYLI